MISKKELQRKYDSGKSMMDISKILGCSVHKVQYWMNEYAINRRSRSEASYFKHNPKGDPFKIKLPRTIEDSILYGLGIGIYWGEGTKVTRHSVRVTNTDPAMLRLFLRFLHKICSVKNSKISCSIVCFNDTDPGLARKYWSSELKISPEKFGKITQIPKQGAGTYKKKSRFGVCAISVSNIKLKTWVMKQIDQVKVQNFVL